jgi:hypothetical protein
MAPHRIDEEVGVATKDKGGGSSQKKQAQHSLKEKRQAKKAKKAKGAGP